MSSSAESVSEDSCAGSAMVNWIDEAGEVLEPTLTIKEIVMVPLSGLLMTTFVFVVVSDVPPVVTVYCA